MKSFSTLAFGVLGVVSVCVVFSGCQRHDNLPNAAGGTVTATLNGARDSSTEIAAIQVVSSDLFYVAGINITSGDTTTLSVTFSDSVDLNTPIPFDGFFTFMEYTDSKSGTAYSNEGTAANPGLVTLTAWNPPTQTIVGTFLGTLYNQANPLDSIVVTAGAFNVAYSVQ
jgi:hypothetical protein